MYATIAVIKKIVHLKLANPCETSEENIRFKMWT